MSIKGSFKKGSLDMLVLALLTSGDKYGYEISQAIGERGSSVLRLPEGSLYPTLYRLEKDGHISSYRKQVGERRMRIYYHLEATGAEKLTELIEEYNAVNEAIQKILSGLGDRCEKS